MTDPTAHDPSRRSTVSGVAPHRAHDRGVVHRRVRGVVAVSLMMAVGLGACSGDDDTTVNESPTSSTSTTVADGASTTAVDGAAVDGAADAATTVDANTASVDEMAAAFEAAGVPNAQRWAHEVEEYRPYSDDGWAHLRQELSKYNIDDATFDQITSTLTL
jgi:hypothetical protein